MQTSRILPGLYTVESAMQRMILFFFFSFFSSPPVRITPTRGRICCSHGDTTELMSCVSLTTTLLTSVWRDTPRDREYKKYKSWKNMNISKGFVIFYCSPPLCSLVFFRGNANQKGREKKANEQ